MKKQFVIVSVLCFIAIVATACNLFSFMGVETMGSEPPPPPIVQSGLIGVTGTVIGTIDDCAFDGSCALIIESDSTIYTVVYAPGMMMCEGTYDGSAVIGDAVEVYGEFSDETVITICTFPDYYMRVVGTSTPASSPATPPPWDMPFTVTGTVIGTIDDCAFDGICALVVDTDSGVYDVIYAPGMMMCEGSYDGNTLIGDTVEIYGELTEQSTITICTSSDYYINTQ